MLLQLNGRGREWRSISQQHTSQCPALILRAGELGEPAALQGPQQCPGGGHQVPGHGGMVRPLDNHNIKIYSGIRAIGLYKSGMQN